MPDQKIFTNDNCVGCNLCITNCPCDEANVAVIDKDGKNKIYVDPDKCIVCGECVRNCTHDARDYTDDTEGFFRDLHAGKKISVIVAPAVRTNFPAYEKLLGFLRQSGAAALYDTSFGADICTWGYLRYIAKHSGEKGLISQPCPVIVNFIERYTPQLLAKLAPVHSPAMCMAIYMRKYKNIQGSYAFISPCIAKRDEFFDENTGLLVDYNITFRKLAGYLKRHGIDYRSSPADHYDNEQHGLGAVFPMPGGLRVNVEQYVDDAWIHQVEGQPHASHFLTDYAGGMPEEMPFLVDILNCQHGCNIGTGALNTERDSLAVGSELQKVKKQLKSTVKRKNKIPGPDFKKLDKDLNLSDFTRHYKSKNLQATNVSPAELESAFLELRKTTGSDRHVDCRSCGYASCQKMAEAVAKKINHKENCVEYFKSVLREQGKQMENLAAERAQQAVTLRQGVESILNGILDSNKHTDITKSDVESIHGQIDLMSDISSKLSGNVSKLQNEIGKYADMSVEIVNISRQTNILALNASVEAAQAGQLGKGFAVVAEQIKRLSDQSQKSAKDAVENNEVIAPLLKSLNEISLEVISESQVISTNANNILGSVDELSRIQQSIAEEAEKIASADQLEGAPSFNRAFGLSAR